MKDKLTSYHPVFVLFLGYTILCWVYYKERVIMPDLSFHLFEILVKDKLAIQNNRFPAVLTQIFPLLSSRINMDLDWIVRLYSLSFPLMYFVGFYILYFLKSERYFLLLFLYVFGISTHSFFWPISEIHIGVLLLIVYFSILDKYDFEVNKLTLLCTIILLPSIIFAYPTMILLVVFLFLFYSVQKKSLSYNRLYLILSILIFFIKIFYFKSDYDNHSMFRALKPENMIHFFSSESTIQLIQYMVKDYYLLIFLYILLTLSYFKQKLWLRLGLIQFYFFGIIYLINSCHPHHSAQFYLEGQYMMLVVVLGFPFVVDFLSNSFFINYKFLILCLIFSLFCIRFFSIYEVYENRLSDYRELIHHYSDKKIIKPSNEKLSNQFLMTWSSSYDIWLLSTIEERYTASIIFLEDINKFDWLGVRNDVFLTNWNHYQYKNLHPSYFKFRDSLSSYQKDTMSNF